jgi:eukaryotic-like serine/threonine-protein kinase
LTDAVQRLATALADRYTIERELGAGGMATVYLAHDVRHDRKVALKVLRPELSAILGAERFLAEIKTTANLQHPHILSLFDSGEADGLVFYVMPYVEGESLRDRLVREKQLPVEDAVRIAREVADALDYAHRHGVVHRDIKPENILLHEGRAQVADFGIALAVSRSDGSTRMTETGMSLGTPHYMSPEQAMGERDITSKADIYALGCVLYEMLTGEPPFTGPTAQAIVARVMTEQPRSLTLQRRTIPPNVEAAVGKALEKLPADRFASAAQFAEALANAAFTSSGVAATRIGPATGRAAWRTSPVASRALRYAPWAVAAGAVAFGVWGSRGARVGHAPPVVSRYAIMLPDSAAYFDQGSNSVSVAADGSAFAYTSSSGGSTMFVRFADRLEPVPVTSARNGLIPFLSPDARWLAFRSGQRLVKVSLAGGVPVVIADSCNGFGFSWGTDDTIRYNQAPSVASPLRQLMAVAASGGTPRVIANPDSATLETYRYPFLIPGTRTVLFTIRTRDADRLASLNLNTGRVKRYDQLGSNPSWVAAGFVLLGERDGSLIAIPFDRSKAALTGAPVTVVSDAIVDAVGAISGAVSADGRLVYAQRGAVSSRNLMMVGRDGRQIDIVSDLRGYAGPRFSPDGRRLAVGIADPGGGSDVWVLDLAQHAWTRLTTDRKSDRPVWTPDGRRLVFASNADLWWVPADGSGAPDSLLPAPGSRFPAAVTPDGRTVIFWESGSQNSGIRTMRIDSAPVAHVILPDAFQESAPALSPDGRWLAYQSSEPGRTEVYVRPFPGPGPRVPVSLNGGVEPAWSRDGRELFYRESDALMSATVRTQPAFEVVRRTRLFSGPYLPGGTFREYDVSPDGGRFVMVRGGRSTSNLVAVDGLFDRMRYDAGRTR